MSNGTTQHTPADVRERVARDVFTLDADWRREYWDQFRRDFPRQAQAYYDTADRILALLRTPSGDGEAWRAFLDALDEFEQVANLWADPEGPTAADMERLRQSRQRVIECARALAALRSEAPGEEDVGEFCHLCREEFDPREPGTVIGPLGQDDGVPRWYRCPRCARAYDAGYQQGQRDPRGDETADPTAIRSEAQGEDRWEDVVFGPITEAYNEAHAARRGDAQEKEDALVCASCGEPIGDEPTVIWQDAYTHYRCTPEDAIRDDTPVIRPIDAARRGEGGGK